MKMPFITRKNDSQLQNSFFIMLGSLSIAGFGFIFWAIVARIFSDATVGIATTLLSVSSLISLLSLAGFDVAFVRFLPKQIDRSKYINSGLIVTSLASLIISLIFIPIITYSNPVFANIFAQPLNVAYFIIFTLFSTLNLLTNSVFLASKSAVYIFMINTAFSVLKVILPLLITFDNPMTIFNIAGISQVIGVALSIGAMIKYLGFKLQLTIDKEVLRSTFKYTLSVYVASVLNLLPPTVLPLMIASQLGTKEPAYYYMAFTIASILYTIAYSAMQSAFAEGSHNDERIHEYIKKGFKLASVLMIPSAVLLIFGANTLLHVFGKSYSNEGAYLLQLFCVSSLFVALYSGIGSILKVKKMTGALIMMNSVYVATIFITAYVLLPSMHLPAVGYAWIAGNILAVCAGLISLKTLSR